MIFRFLPMTIVVHDPSTRPFYPFCPDDPGIRCSQGPIVMLVT
jgi:hypothetical protein